MKKQATFQSNILWHLLAFEIKNVLNKDFSKLGPQSEFIYTGLPMYHLTEILE